ncbi:MAG: triose-phosphate isomerase family protein, partial [bacterium]
CVGETLEQREAGQTEQVVRSQCSGSLEGLSHEQMLKTVLAYEPVWAIGTGKTATPEDAQEVCAAIRKELIKIGSEEISQNARILYGGSVKSANIVDIMKQVDIDGALVGGASLEPEEFARICKFHRVI